MTFHFFCTGLVWNSLQPNTANIHHLSVSVFLLVWWSCQLPLAALQITKSSLTCWWPSQRRFTPCLTQQYQTATSRPWLRCVTWRTESWWSTSAGPNISQVGEKKNCWTLTFTLNPAWLHVVTQSHTYVCPFFFPAPAYRRFHTHTIAHTQVGNTCCVNWPSTRLESAAPDAVWAQLHTHKYTRC